MLLGIFIAIAFLYSLVSQRLERTVFTAPIIFALAGMLMSFARGHVIQAGMNPPVFLRLAETGLVLLLFSDASHADLNVLRSITQLPARLLSVGLLLTIALGALTARRVFPYFSLWEACIVGTILAPTDAGLGEVIISSPRVPTNIRQALNVEAGLNDGLCVPFLLFFMALADVRIEGGEASLMQFIVEQLGIGSLIGLAVGLAGGRVLRSASQSEWMAVRFQQIAVVALPLMCIVLSELFGASMFIASFVAGLAVQKNFKEAGKHSVEFAEEWGQLLNLSVFFLFGMLVVRDWPQFGPSAWLYAVISLTVVRMLPVAVALVGTHLGTATTIFMGWFGPRGLASIVLGMVYLEQELHLPHEPTIRSIVIVTVFLSIFLHGLTALPGVSLYTSKLTPPTQTASAP
ncbi:MAG TPA: cation:proton antiporter [Tepidisphaeraceae bacterium]|nr:cation:proton antiporter [Tepidisphaeraceae bacterium]